MNYEFAMGFILFRAAYTAGNFPMALYRGPSEFRAAYTAGNLEQGWHRQLCIFRAAYTAGNTRCEKHGVGF